MSYQNRLVEEINGELDALADEGKAWSAAWITQAICKKHEAGLSGRHRKNAEFWRFCGYAKCRDEVRRCINQRAGDVEDPAEGQQLTLPGYAHVQRYYIVRRGKEEIGVPVETMTDEEIQDKERKYHSMGTACHAHARDLERYRLARTQSKMRFAS